MKPEIANLAKLPSFSSPSGLAGCSKPPEPAAAAQVRRGSKGAPRSLPRRRASPTAPAHEDAGIAWRKGDVDAAFAAAKAEGKPVFLYWGATWCPPCNQVKATIFNRQDFIERSRHFVPVYVDGDSPNAQKEGARFKVSGYPTMVLFTPDGTEITRLPGEVDADQYMRVLTMGMNGARAGEGHAGCGARARRGRDATSSRPKTGACSPTTRGSPTSSSSRPRRNFAATLARLAKACPADQADTATRLELQALAAAAAEGQSQRGRQEPAAGRLIAVLGDDEARRARTSISSPTTPGSIAGYVAPALVRRRVRG